MDKENVLKFFTGKYFRIPEYQRDYAWTTENVDELIEDIVEAIDTGTNHYLGTFILAKPRDDEKEKTFFMSLMGNKE